MAFEAAPGFDRKKLKTSYRASPSSLKPIYTGGPAIITQDGEWLITSLGASLLITEVKTGREICRVKGDGTAITAITLSYHSYPPVLITAHQSLSIRYYPLPEPTEVIALSSKKSPFIPYIRQLTRSQTHQSPILVLTATEGLFASGSADGVVKVWDSAGGYTTHVLKGHGGPVSALRFRVAEQAINNGGANFKGKGREDSGRVMQVITGCVDAKVRVFDLLDPIHRNAASLGAGRALYTLDGHVSVVRGIDTTPDGRWLVTAGRDKVVLVWDMEISTTKGKKISASEPKIVQTILAHETIESVGVIDAEDLEERQGLGKYAGRVLCYTGGERGVIRIWDLLQGAELETLAGAGTDEEDDDVDEDEEEQRGISSAILADGNIVAIHHDHNIVFHSLRTLQVARQVIGFNDEIIDAAYLDPTHLALATNSSLIRVYDTKTLDARLISGHTDVVLCLNQRGNLLASGSKDNTAKVWVWENGTLRCIATCTGHAESIGAVVLSQDGKVLFTASMDRTVKMWDLTQEKPRSISTMKVHDKDINSLDLSPNDQFLATGSQDKLVKIFAVQPNVGFKLLGECKGHKRGIWSVKFSPTDRVIASGAADRTIKLWSLDDFTCIKTFEGHTNSVLRVDFLTKGMQLVSTASDGLVKLWNIRDEECIKTLDGHEDKIWALAIGADEKTIVSGGADSRVVFWEDCSVEEEREQTQKREREVADEQDFVNYLGLKDYRRAIQLALAMAQPGRLFKLFTTVHKERSDDDSVTGSLAVDEVLKTLSPLDLVRLLKYVRDWNARAKTSDVAQRILHAVLKQRKADELLEAFEIASRVDGKKAEEDDAENEDDVMDVDEEAKPKARVEKPAGLISIQDLLDGLIPYTERHYERVDKMLVDSYMVDYVLGEMDGGLIDLDALDDLNIEDIPMNEREVDAPAILSDNSVQAEEEEQEYMSVE